MAKKRISTMEMYEKICSEDRTPPYYKLVPELNGIEIYFSEKPTDETIGKLKSNHWRWHPTKQCWYNKKSNESLSFANNMCAPYEKQLTEELPTFPVKNSMFPPPIIVPPQTVSFDMMNGKQIIGTFSITKVNHGYSIQSTNNLISCCDCYRYFSIHAPTCPSCGCPSAYIAEFYYQKGIEDLHQHEREETARRKQDEERRRQELELAEAKRRAAEKLRQEELARKREEQERKRKEEERLRTRAAEIKEICKNLFLPDSVINELAKSSVDDQTLRVRVDRILYYQINYPELDIQAVLFIKNDDLGKYVLSHTTDERDKRVECIGNCSTCRRDVCVMNERD